MEHAAHPDMGARGRRAFVRVLEVDPELGLGLSEDEKRRAARFLLARSIRIASGPWDPLHDLGPEEPGALAMLVVDGLLARRVTVPGGSSVELLGAGDVVRPLDNERDADHPLRTITWSALAPTDVALLDAEFASVAARWPQISVELLRRAMQRASGLACHLAISHIVGVEMRIFHLLAQLSERWGRVTPEGILVPIPLPNEMLGAIIGARPPSVSTALQKLARAGLLVRRSDGGWLLQRQATEGCDETARVRLMA